MSEKKTLIIPPELWTNRDPGFALPVVHLPFQTYLQLIGKKGELANGSEPQVSEPNREKKKDVKVSDEYNEQ